MIWPGDWMRRLKDMTTRRDESSAIRHAAKDACLNPALPIGRAFG